MRTAAISILLLLAAFTGTSFAAQAAVTSDPSLVDLAKPVFDAIMHGQPLLAGALGIVLICGVARRYMPASWKTGVKGDIIGTALAFGMAFFGAVASALTLPGGALSFAIFVGAFKVGALAIGGYTVIHKIAGWLEESEWLAKRAPWVRALLKMTSGLFGSDAIKKAEKAGDDAVAAQPPTGMAGGEDIVEVE